MKNEYQKQNLRRAADAFRRRKTPLCTGVLVKEDSDEEYRVGMACAVGDLLVRAGVPVQELSGRSVLNFDQRKILSSFYGIERDEIDEIIYANDDARDNRRNARVAARLRELAKE